MHDFVVKFSSPQVARGHLPPNQNPAVVPGRGYLSGSRCRLAYGPADATVSCVQIGFTFLVPAQPGSPGQMAVEWVFLDDGAMNAVLLPGAARIVCGAGSM